MELAGLWVAQLGLQHVHGLLVRHLRQPYNRLLVRSSLARL